MTKIFNSDTIFDIIEEIANARGNAKKLYLCDDLIPYFLAAYDPYVQYYTNRIEESVMYSRGEKQFDSVTWNLLHLLSQRKLSGLRAQLSIDAHLSALTPKSARLLVRILNKDLRMGMGAKTINKCFPGKIIPTHDIMLAFLYDPSRVKFPVWGSPKIDGVRATFLKRKFYSRGGLVYNGLETLEEELKDFVLRLDGELIVPGVSFQVGSGLIRSDEPTPEAEFHIFELPTAPVTFRERVTMMRELDGFSPHVKIVYQKLLNSHDEIQDFYDWCRREGYEGAIIRSYDYKYVGNRSYNWMKIKPKMKDLCLKVIGAYEGTGKYRGMLGGVTVRYLGSKGIKNVDVGSGFTDAQRRDFWQWPGECTLIHQYIQAEAMEETDDGSLRHPVFKEVKEIG